MSEISDIKRLLYPLVKGLPWVILFVSFCVFTSWRLTTYQTPVFESRATILLDDHTSGFSDNNLYEDLDIFSETNNVLTEVQVVKSNVILLEALNRMPTNIEYYRVGQIRTSELYDQTPFSVGIDTNRFSRFNKLLRIKVLNTHSYELFLGSDTLHFKFGDSVKVNGGHFVINKEQNWIEEHDKTNFLGDYLFRVNTPDFLLSNFVNGNLFVKEIDKNVSVIQINFEGENAKRVADFTNAIAKSYLDDHIITKMKAAQLTESFLDERTNATKQSLEEAEDKLESFRLDNRILNIRQETETELRKISALEVQAVNLQLKMVVMDSLEKSIGANLNGFLEAAPSYEAYGGLLFTTLVKKIKLLESERTDLSVRFSEKSSEIQTIDKKIEDHIQYIVKNIQSHRENTAFQLAKMSEDIAEAKEKMNRLPTSEKKMVNLTREFSQQQDLFNFLKKKEMEAGIAKLARLHFHRVINEAREASGPSRPNKGFNVALAAFLSMLVSISFIYIREAIRSKISSRFQLENLTDSKVLGAVKYNDSKAREGGFVALIGSLLPFIKNHGGYSISVNSSIAAEGKTYIAHEMATNLASLGYKTLLVDFNSRNPKWSMLKLKSSTSEGLEKYISGELKIENVIYSTENKHLSVCGYSKSSKAYTLHLSKDFESRLTQLKLKYDLIIFDNPAFTIAPEAKVFITNSDFAVFVVRNNFTSTKFIKIIDDIVDEIGNEHVGLVLNEVPQGVNYSGDFYGSRYTYNKPKGITARLKHYWDSYKHAWNVE